MTPTSWISRSLSLAEGLTPFVMEKVQQVSEVHAEAVRIAHASGLKMLTGTDPILPNMHGRNYMKVVSLIQDGLSPLSAWYAGIGFAAQRIGQDDTGSLIPEKRADLLLCASDVIENPALFDQDALVEVIKDGIGYRGAVTDIPQRTFESTVRDSLAPLS